MANLTQADPAVAASPAIVPGGTPAPDQYRWAICGLLFLATTINYIDRAVIGVLKPHLSERLNWTEIDYSNIVFAFQMAYALGYLFAGRLLDLIGVRVGYALSVLLWSLAAMSHGLVSSVFGFAAARFGLGLAEGGNFPAAVKTVSEWFQKKERAFATGIFNAGSNVGAMVTPLTAPWIAVTWGWQAAFFITGAIGLAWLALWLLLYRKPALPANEEQVETRKIGWLELLRYRPTWAFVLSMFMTSPIWWFYLYWVPDFLNKKHGLDILRLGPPLIAIYLMADVGSIAGGWLSLHLIKRGWTVNAARKIALLSCALCVLPVYFASQVSSMWGAVLLIGLAAAAHQGWSANLYTLVSDTMPRNVVSSIVGLGGFAGAVGGMLIAKLAGYVLEWTGNYLILFGIASCAYLVALLCIQLLVPKIESSSMGQS